VLSATYSGGGLSYTQSFSYDSLNRLSTAAETTGSTTNWSQNDHYDQYGNRQIDYGGGSYNLTFSSTTNRITTSGFTYDSNGNLTNDTVHAYTFDAENKILKVDSTTAYAYDGEGHRVRKLLTGDNTRFVSGIGGQLVGEFDGSSGNLKKEYVSSITIEPTAVNSNGTQYPTGDNLGSPRVITNSSASVVGRHDYMPFGEDLGAGTGGRTTGMGFGGGSSDNNRKKFTGYERDTESGLDYAQARYYSNMQGRFTSVDPLASSATVVDPQTWNRYTYTSNDPVNLSDPSGMEVPKGPSDSRWLAGMRGGYMGEAEVFAGPITNGMHGEPTPQQQSHHLSVSERAHQNLSRTLEQQAMANSPFNSAVQRAAQTGAFDRISTITPCRDFFTGINPQAVSILNPDSGSVRSAVGSSYINEYGKKEKFLKDQAIVTISDADSSGGKAASGTINFNDHSYFFSGTLESGQSLLSVRGSTFGLTMGEIRQLMILHEDTHVVDTAGRYNDFGNSNRVLNLLIRTYCFPGR
jgi:RHS repeat-associated protein